MFLMVDVTLGGKVFQGSKNPGLGQGMAPYVRLGKQGLAVKTRHSRNG